MTDEMLADLDAAAREGLGLPRQHLQAFRLVGGKGKAIAWIRRYIPTMPVYVEPFAGAATILLNRPPAPIEVLNDLDGRIVNFFRVMQDAERCRALLHRLIWTPYARAEFVRAIEEQYADDPVTAAWAFFTLTHQAFAGKVSAKLGHGNWGRTVTPARGMAETALRWGTNIAALPRLHRRLMRVQIDQRDAVECIRYWDSADTCFYVDPPYVSATRRDTNIYRHEMTDDAHRALVETIRVARGAVVLSGYASELYAPLEEAGWLVRRRHTVAFAGGSSRSNGRRGRGALLKAASRTEVLWLNPCAAAALGVLPGTE